VPLMSRDNRTSYDGMRKIDQNKFHRRKALEKVEGGINLAMMSCGFDDLKVQS
jgi:hypothetical protein